MGQFLYYSTQTQLAYRICNRYLKGHFYVHCTEEFAPRMNPGSSNPSALYEHFQQVVEQDDRGDTQVWRIKQRLKEVALAKQKELGRKQFRTLLWEIEHAQTRDFLPILYLIQKSELKAAQRKQLPPELCANPNSVEFTITDLVESQFDKIESSLKMTNSL